MSNIGMMDAAFFVGKNELLSWLNELLQLNYTKVEQCANGAAYCQIMDAIYPVRPRAARRALQQRVKQRAAAAVRPPRSSLADDCWSAASWRCSLHPARLGSASRFPRRW